MIATLVILAYSCNVTNPVDTEAIREKRKSDSLWLVYRAHSDSIQKMYTSIQTPRNWVGVYRLNKKAGISHKDCARLDLHIWLDISTEPKVYLVWDLGAKDAESFTVTKVLQSPDSTIFYTYDKEEKSVEWIVTYIEKDKQLVSWTRYDPLTKTRMFEGYYSGEDE